MSERGEHRMTRKLWDLAAQRAGESPEPYPPELETGGKVRIYVGDKVVGMAGRDLEHLEPLILPGIIVEKIS
jgi:hypothetical protein